MRIRPFIVKLNPECLIGRGQGRELAPIGTSVAFKGGAGPS